LSGINATLAQVNAASLRREQLARRNKDETTSPIRLSYYLAMRSMG
jgi:hypothetical protein